MIRQMKGKYGIKICIQVICILNRKYTLTLHEALNLLLIYFKIFRFLDPNAGPLSELERWKRRLRLLTSITEQLKGKECKAVMGVLITAKSRLLKKWKLIDSW